MIDNVGHMLVGNVHLLPLPGSPRYSGGGLGPIIERAVEESRILADAGFDSVLLQNAGDGNHRRDGGVETAAYMTAIGAEVRAAIPFQLGFNVLPVGGPTALAIAHAIGARYVRVKIYVGAVVTADGVVGSSYREVLAFRKTIGAEDISIVADVFDRSSWPVGDISIEEAAKLAIDPGRADVLVITGRSVDESMRRARAVKNVLPRVPIWCGGGSTPDNIAQLLTVYDGAIVGQGVKVAGDIRNKMDPRLSSDYVKQARAARTRT